MKSILIAVLALFLTACSTFAEKKCVQRYLDDSYALEYDGCAVSLEVSRPATDFHVLLFKSKNEAGRVLLSIYKGGAPDVENLQQNESRIVKRVINGLQSEILERFDDGEKTYKYEALITLPKNAQGRVFYLHLQHEGVARDDLKKVKVILESITPN